MKKTLLATALLTTMALGNVALAASTDDIEKDKGQAGSTNTINVETGKAAITAAPSYEFSAITAEDIALGEVKGKGLAPSSPDNQKLSFKNDTLKNITLTVSVAEAGTADFLTGFTMHYGAGTDESATGDNKVNTEAFDLNLESSKVIVENNASVGQHELILEAPTADFTFDKSKINESKETYQQTIIWKLTDGTEQPEGENTL